MFPRAPLFFSAPLPFFGRQKKKEFTPAPHPPPPPPPAHPPSHFLPKDWGYRNHLRKLGKTYIELIIFQNMDNGMDLYMHNSIWPEKNWALYKLHNVNDLALWHTGGLPNKKIKKTIKTSNKQNITQKQIHKMKQQKDTTPNKY